MKVKILKDYNDLQLKRLVTVAKDKTLDVTEARAKELIAAGVAEEIKEAEAPKEPKPAKKPKKKAEK